MYCSKSDNLPTLLCDGCKNPVHINCAQIDADDAKRITRQHAKGVKFYCTSCNSNSDHFSELKDLLKNLSARLEKLESKSTLLNDLTPECFESVVREVRERIKRENNVILYGVPEKDDTNTVSTVAQILHTIKPIDTPTVTTQNIVRLGQRDKDVSKSRPVRVTFSNVDEVRFCLRNKHLLKSSPNFKTIYIKNDETHYQRELLAKCKTELKERIDNGEDNITIKYSKGVPSIIQKN